MANKILIKRGTRTQLNSAITGATLNIGELYFITDENRIAVGTANNAYQDFAKVGEGGTVDADIAAIAALTGTGVLKRTGPDTWTLDTSTYITAEAPNFNGTNGAAFAGSTSGSAKLVAPAAAGTGTVITLPATTGTLALTSAIPTVNSGTLGVSIGTAGATNTSITWGTSSGFNANTATNTTYDLKVGPSISALATFMTTATAGFIRRTGQDTYGIDTNTYYVSTTRLDQITLAAADVNLNSQKITGLAAPTAGTDAANKDYVDGVVQGLDPKASVRAATTANITLSNTQTIDGVVLAVNDRVLVKNQTTVAQNGIYLVASGAWTRAPDADSWNELISAFVFVEDGTANADNGFVCTANAGGTIGVTDVNFVQFSGAGQITAGAGLTKTGNQLDVGGTTDRITVGADAIDISANYVGQATITTLGTIGTGTWNATAIGVTKGGTGLTAAVTGLLKGNGTSYSAATEGTDYLSANSTIDGGTF